MLPRVCVGYLNAHETPLLNLSLATLLGHPWVEQIVVLDTTTNFPDRHLGDRLLHFGREFGAGFDRNVSEGGFNEVLARNLLLQTMRWQAGQYYCDWLLLCDPDEFFTAGAIELLQQADQQRLPAVLFECWHALNPEQHVPKPVAAPAGLTLNDPHPRAVRSEQSYKFIPRLNSPEINETMHCGLSVPWRVAIVRPSCCHVHVRGLFKASAVREPTEPLPPIAWPKLYLKAWANGWQASDGYSDTYPLPEAERPIR